MEENFNHVPVLLNECIEGLNIKPDGVYVDCTLGGGGHSGEIAKRLTTGRLISIDKDEDAIAYSKKRLEAYKDKITFVHDDFKNIESILKNLSVSSIDGVLADLGVSSYQIDVAERGFSYMKDAPLDMRMDRSQSFSAYDVVNGYDEEKLQKIREEAVRQIEEAKELNALNDVRVSVLGKKGELTAVLKGMKDVKPEDRPMVGQLVNETREAIERTLEETKKKLESAELEHRLEKEVIDVTLPAKQNSVGHRHPNMIALEEVERIFVGMGYEVVEGPEVEQDYYNFEALNIPKNHPARDEQDTFYINDSIVLRTQTSPVQVRVMEEGKLPIRMIAPGRVFRSDEVDATHSPSFHQIEGMVVDKNITFADLKGTLAEFAKELFGEDTKVKFRPHHFPFTEPSAEMDVTCFKCGGKGCRFCKGEGWIEILGCGMVHPKVLRMSGIDPEEYSGFAFGVGLERIALLKYEIDDMRLLYENDIRFLKQF